MKKIIIGMIITFSVITNSFAQTAITPAPVATATPDFYAGKWELSFIGTPQGDVKLIAHLSRESGKLTGKLLDATDTEKEPIPISNIEEEENKIVLYFSAQGYDLNVNLEKVDADNLKGQLMNMFEAKAVRTK
ncbi:MAG: hypothetical protein JNL70_25470 [Saprospiraceae bacterium]|nr:hypothetical protein [Saprospiraceae bacterium]